MLDQDPSAVAGGESVGVPSLRKAVAVLGAVLGRPRRGGRQAPQLAVELAKIVVGRSTLAPSPRDRRFTDAAWSQNPVSRRLVQSYLTGTGALESLVDDFEASTEDDRSRTTGRADQAVPTRRPGSPGLSAATAAGGTPRHAGSPTTPALRERPPRCSATPTTQ